MKLYNFIKIITLITISCLTIGLFLASPAPHDRILNIQNYLITVSGIFSGIVIAYLASKLFNIKQDRLSRQIEIDKLSEKLTNYRRILYAVMNSHDFWLKFEDIRKFKKKYQTLDFEKLHNQDQDNSEDESIKFWLDEKDLSSTTIDLYSSMEAIYGKHENDRMPWIYEKTIKFDYSLDELYRFHMPTNQIWYYLEGRYQKHTEGLINDKGIWVLYRDKVRDWASQIDNKFRSKEFDRHLLAEVSTDFHEYYLPKLIELTTINSDGLPRSVIRLFTNLVIIFLIGVIFPLFIQSMCLLDNWNVILTLTAVGIITLSFIYFLFDFYLLMKEEIKPK